MGGNLPWNLIFVGIAIAVVVEILGIPVLPFAVGLYLPIYLSVPIMVGALVRTFFEKRKKWSEEKRKTTVDNGVLYCSGMIAGEGLIGILLAVFAVIPLSNEKSLGDLINLTNYGIDLGNIGGLVFFAILLATIFVFATKKSKKDR